MQENNRLLEEQLQRIKGQRAAFEAKVNEQAKEAQADVQRQRVALQADRAALETRRSRTPDPSSPYPSIALTAATVAPIVTTPGSALVVRGATAAVAASAADAVETAAIWSDISARKMVSEYQRRAAAAVLLEKSTAQALQRSTRYFNDRMKRCEAETAQMQARIRRLESETKEAKQTAVYAMVRLRRHCYLF